MSKFLVLLNCSPLKIGAKMEMLKQLNKEEPLLLLCSDKEHDSFKEFTSEFKKCSIFKKEEIDEKVSDMPNDSVQTVLISSTCADIPAVLPKLHKILRPSGQIIFNKLVDVDKTKYDLMTNGFMNVTATNNDVTATKPKFEVGSFAKLNLSKNVPAVWKLDDDLDDEIIDPDNLLDEEDLKKPDPTSLRVCGTTGLRKACKDCSCGLADELVAGEKEKAKMFLNRRAETATWAMPFVVLLALTLVCRLLNLEKRSSWQEINLQQIYDELLLDTFKEIII